MNTPFIEIAVALICTAIVAWFINTRFPALASVRPILNVVLALIVVGIALWLINTYVPMAGSIKALLNIVVVVASCVWVLQAVGLWGRVTRLFHDLTSHHLPG